jgi:hypothetical protein
MPSGSLPADKWTKVLWGWGKYSVRYSAYTDAPGAKFRCFSAPVPWPIASGPLPSEVTHTVVGYGDVWLYCPEDTQYYLHPLGPDPVPRG